jgi:hypothetical protein
MRLCGLGRSAALRDTTDHQKWQEEERGWQSGSHATFFQAIFSNDSEVAQDSAKPHSFQLYIFWAKLRCVLLWKVWVMRRHCYSAGAEGLRYKGPVINNLS